MGKKVEAKMSKIDQAGYNAAFAEGVMTERGSETKNTGDINTLIASSTIHAYNSGIMHGQRIQTELILDLLKVEGALTDRIQMIVEASK